MPVEVWIDQVWIFDLFGSHLDLSNWLENVFRGVVFSVEPFAFLGIYLIETVPVLGDFAGLEDQLVNYFS